MSPRTFRKRSPQSGPQTQPARWVWGPDHDHPGRDDSTNPKGRGAPGVFASKHSNVVPGIELEGCCRMVRDGQSGKQIPVTQSTIHPCRRNCVALWRRRLQGNNNVQLIRDFVQTGQE